MTDRAKIQVFVGLLLIAAAVFFYERNPTPSMPEGVSADTRFTPLNVKEPALQLDKLRKLQEDEYKGTQRNIFVAAPTPPAAGAAAHTEEPHLFVGPQPAPPPPPLQVPVEFYGIETSGGREVALLKNGDDIIIAGEGDTFMNRYRLVHIGNQSAEVQEISTGRQTTIPLVPPVDQGSGSQN
ncbi:MAG TPA: hypothetical protein VMB47_03050 [Candidatus Aquilonibacter sp.]|nr:hypothetical protein [Candidatus Aquilonibacter sp.]